MSQFLYLIPLFPLLGFLFNFIVGVRILSPRHAGGHGSEAEGHHGPNPLIGIVACGTVLLSFLASVAAVLEARGAGEHSLLQVLWTWIPGGAFSSATGLSSFHVDWAYLVDPLSSVMLMVVTFVGLLIHIYSTGYMGHDPGYARFVSYLNLFMFAMLTLVMGANYLLLFVGWEGVGLCSYLLIGFWFDRQSASDAGKKAFIVNRIGDTGFVLGIFLMFVTFGSADFHTVMAAVSSRPVEWAWGGALTVIALSLFVGACGKSAQIPLYVWLPDAMEGPTPVSALIHAATMVTAGVYMVARSAPIYSRAPQALLVVAVIGAATAIFAATIGLVQNDIKRVLAYSTVSQLGYMFLACGVGAYTAGIFHLATHAFFKALLFLGSGSVIHGMSGEQDMRKMGGLSEKMPVTRWTMLIGCVAIAGIPLFAGFFSKDEILWSAFRVGGYGRAVWAVGFLAAGLTAFYMFRLYWMTFGGSFRGTPEQAHHLHESPGSMTWPLRVLAAGAALAGFIGLPFGRSLIEPFLEPNFETSREALAEVFRTPAEGFGLEVSLMAVSVAMAGVGILVALRLYRAPSEIPARLAAMFPGSHRLLLNKYYVDEAYEAFFVQGLALGGGDAFYQVDRYVVDGAGGEFGPGLGVNGVAWAVREGIARFSSGVVDRFVDFLVNLTGAILDNASYVFRAVQNGLVQRYALSMLIGFLLMIAAQRWIL